MTIAVIETSKIITYALAAVFIGYVLYNFLKAKKRMNLPPSENIKILNDGNFKQVTSSGVSLVDFWAEWCGPCKILGPTVNEVADEIGDKAKICKLDVDKNPQTSQKFGIRSIPTIVIFKNGKPVDRLVGVKSKKALIDAVMAHV